MGRKAKPINERKVSISIAFERRVVEILEQESKKYGGNISRTVNNLLINTEIDRRTIALIKTIWGEKEMMRWIYTKLLVSARGWDVYQQILDGRRLKEMDEYELVFGDGVGDLKDTMSKCLDKDEMEFLMEDHKRIASIGDALIWGDVEDILEKPVEINVEPIYTIVP